MSQPNSIMKSIEDFKVPLASGVIGIAIGLVSKHVFKTETIRVNNLGNTFVSFASVTASAIVAEYVIRERERL